LSLEKHLSYCGGPIALLNEGTVAVIPAGPLLILREVDKETVKEEGKGDREAEDEEEDDEDQNRSVVTSGFARHFKHLPPSPSPSPEPSGNGFAFIRVHSNPITILELSPTQSLMVSCEGKFN